MAMACFQELRAYGADDVLSRIYGRLYQVNRPENGFDVTLLIDLEQLPNNQKDRGLLDL